MYVLVTGATGFVGAWTAKAAVDAGHEARLFVRDPARLSESAAAIGVKWKDVATGDITDADSVGSALEGCDAVVHCASVVATERRRAAEIRATNLTGARNVLGAAVERGLDPVVHVSSVTALFRPGLHRMHADLPVAGGYDAYGRSKAAVDAYARELQDSGASVVITYPGMVLGPPAGRQLGEAAEGLVTILKSGVVLGLDAAWIVVDVRDLASVHAALLEPGRGPRRYMVGGHYLRAPQLARLLSSVIGRRVLLVPVPGAALRMLSRIGERFTSSQTAASTEAAMQYYTQLPPSDDEPSRRDLGVRYRDPRETIADAVRGLASLGRIPAREAGRAVLR